MTTYVALLYTIVLNPTRRIVMSDLRSAAQSLGFRHVRTLIATGNLVFETENTAVLEVENALENAVERRFEKRIDVIVRDALGWRRLVAANPFPEASKLHPSQVAVRVQRDPIPPATLVALARYTSENETLRVVDGDLWIDFRAGISTSRLSAALTPKRLGKGTSRNWNTIRRLGDMLES